MFKDIVCIVPHRDCGRCVLHSSCAYPYVFEPPYQTPQSVCGSILRPHIPLSSYPALTEKRLYQPGDMLYFDLTLIGRGIDYLPYFIYTVTQFSERSGLGKGRGKCTLTSVTWQTPKGQRVSLYDNDEQKLHDDYQPVTLAALDSHMPSGEQLDLRFLTPTRLVYSGHLVPEPHFHILFRMLLRRISNLMYFHCGTELDVDFRALIQAATHVEKGSSDLQWYDWKRYSSRQQRHLKQGGLVGTVTYHGNLQPFWPFLQLGVFTHVGKGTSFGLGKFRIL